MDKKHTVLIDTGRSGMKFENKFRIIRPIGEAPDGGLQVYQAACIGDYDFTTYSKLQSKDGYVSLQYVEVPKDLEHYLALKSQVERHRKVYDHENLLSIRPPFAYNGYYCVVFPEMAFSLRSRMASTYISVEFSEKFIVTALKLTLKGLYQIHKCGEVHEEISAGHIFFNEERELKLAFAASVYDSYKDKRRDSSSSFLPSSSIYRWAAAPEVYYNNHRGGPEADIWMIGITALELACGELKVKNREELDYIVAKINMEKKLPIRTDKNFSIGCVGVPRRRRRMTFSHGFQDMVVKCLAIDPAKRPGSAGLLLRDCDLFHPVNDTSILREFFCR